MAFHAKQRILYYKRFKVDIWGIFKNTLQLKKDKYNNFLGIYSGKAGFFKFISKTNKRKYKAQLIYRDYYFSKKEEKRGYKWRGMLVTKKMKEWLPKYWISTDYVKDLSLNYILISNLFFKVFRIKIKKKLIKIFSIFNIKARIKKKIYYRHPFIYEVRDKVIRKKIYFTKKQFASLRIARLFYIIYNYKQLKILNKKAKKKDGLFEQNYILLMECKLSSFIYRSSLFSNMFESIIFVKNNNVWINKKFIPYIYYVVKSTDFVGFRILHKIYIYWNFFKRLRRRAFIFLLPKYIYISLIFLWLILIRIPLKNDIINPISIDLYRISNYVI